MRNVSANAAVSLEDKLVRTLPSLDATNMSEIDDM